jgi:hypothetical protein
MRWFILAVFVVGLFRFILTVAGLPNRVVKFSSMTAVIIAGIVYFAVATTSHWERFKASYLLILPYMIIEAAALGFTWASGRETIFHALEYSFGGTPLPFHFIGHIVGGLTWEPWILFVLMEVIWLITRRAEEERDRRES